MKLTPAQVDAGLFASGLLFGGITLALYVYEFFLKR